MGEEKPVTEIKEFEEVWLWIERNIISADSLVKLNGCESLIEKFFLERKFKDEPTAKKKSQIARLLFKSIKRKKENIYRRNTRGK